MASQNMQFPGLAVPVTQFSEVVDLCVVPFLVLHARITASPQRRIFSLVVRGMNQNQIHEK